MSWNYCKDHKKNKKPKNYIIRSTLVLQFQGQTAMFTTAMAQKIKAGNHINDKVG